MGNRLSMRPHDFWQELFPPGSFPVHPGVIHDGLFPATLPGGRQIALPIRQLPGDGGRAVASLIVNQASFAVEDALADAMADHAREFEPEIVIGVPTLGLPLANGVARRLGHARMVALGTSRKFWYDEALSVPLSSITSPGQQKRLYLDPRMLPLLEARRVIVVDDVISTGTSAAAVLTLLAKVGIAPVGMVFAMQQTGRWRDMLDPQACAKVRSAVTTPLLVSAPAGGWIVSGDP